MNCTLCNLHILATTQVSWNGGNYHADCIGEVIAQNRAEQEQPPVTMPELEQLEQYDAEFYDEDNGEDIEFQDDIDEFEEDFADAIARLDNEPIVPEIMPSDYQPSVEIPINFPHGSVMVAPRAIIHPPTNGTLVAGLKGSRFVGYPELKNLPMPEQTTTFKPVPFYEFVTKLLQGLWDRRMKVVSDEYIISADGMKLFGLIELENEFNGVRFAVGLRTSNDKSTRLALACGYKVMCCSNGMLSGDFLPLAVKHTANLELDDSLALGIDRIRRRFGDLETSIRSKQEKLIGDQNAKEFIYNAFTLGKFPVSLFRTVHSEYFVKPSYEEFKPRTVFSLENAFTTAFKKLQPLQQFEQTARLGKFITELSNN